MTLFVVVERRKATGKEYIGSGTPADGYVEYSAALTDAGALQEDMGPDWEIYVGRVVPVEEAT